MVHYAGPKTAPSQARAEAVQERPPGVLTFGIKGGREKSIKFMDSSKMIAIVTHVADARSCVLHPASHTHRQLTDQQLMDAGIQPDLIRASPSVSRTSATSLQIPNRRLRRCKAFLQINCSIFPKELSGQNRTVLLSALYS